VSSVARGSLESVALILAAVSCVYKDLQVYYQCHMGVVNRKGGQLARFRLCNLETFCGVRMVNDTADGSVLVT
jgi:hypothetical protein